MALQSSRPGIQILIDVGTSQHLVEQVRLGRLDFALARIPAEEDATLFEYRPIGLEPMCIVARKQHELASLALVKIEDLIDRDWVLPSARNGAAPQKRSRLLYSKGLRPPEHVIETESFEVSLAITLASDCLMVASQASARL